MASALVALTREIAKYIELVLYGCAVSPPSGTAAKAAAQQENVRAIAITTINNFLFIVFFSSLKSIWVYVIKEILQLEDR